MQQMRAQMGTGGRKESSHALPQSEVPITKLEEVMETLYEMVCRVMDGESETEQIIRLGKPQDDYFSHPLAVETYTRWVNREN